MAKITKSVSISKASLYCDNGEWFAEEIDKDESRLYCLSDILRNFEGCEGVSISVKIDDPIPTSKE